jgi:hypothetical protein
MFLKLKFVTLLEFMHESKVFPVIDQSPPPRSLFKKLSYVPQM